MVNFSSDTMKSHGSDQLLKEAQVGRLATCSDDQPYIVPISFVYGDGKIIFHGARTGKKMENIAANNQVSFEVDESEFIPGDDPCKLHWKFRSVVASGKAKVLEDPDEIVPALQLLVEKYSPGLGSLITQKRVDSYANLALVEITVEEMTERVETD